MSTTRTIVIALDVTAAGFGLAGCGSTPGAATIASTPQAPVTVTQSPVTVTQQPTVVSTSAPAPYTPPTYIPPTAPTAPPSRDSVVPRRAEHGTRIPRATTGSPGPGAGSAARCTAAASAART